MSPTATTAPGGSWSLGSLTIPTRWTATVPLDRPRDGYPRPLLVRERWECLNGLWDYCVTPWGAPEPSAYQGQILVPFPIESALSGVQRSLQPDQWLWYRRELQRPATEPGERVLLHFDAVDFEATVTLNGAIMGSHCGGYQRFSFDVTEHLHEGANELVVRVADPTNLGPNPQGKQTLEPVFVYYTASSGIWQTVWLEVVSETSVRGLRTVTDVPGKEVVVDVDLDGPDADVTVEVDLLADGVAVATGTSNHVVLGVTEPRLWCPDDPFLYDLDVRVVRDGVVIDAVKSYVGLRTIEVRRDDLGTQRIFLNGAKTYNLGVVDQGFWPDGLYAAPADEAIRFDVAVAKTMGFNSIRKHIKIEPERWYAECDRLGLLVWQDMPSGSNDDALARAHFEQELTENIAQLRNHPSIVCWVPFNEGWGAYDQERITRRVKELDPTRLVNGQSGSYHWMGVQQWVHRRRASGVESSQAHWHEDAQMLQWDEQEVWLGGNLADIHFYPGPRMGPPMAGMARVTGEHGSFGCYAEGHVWDELLPVGTGLGRVGLSPAELVAAYRASAEELAALEVKGLSGSQYFQLSDVEQEQQGLVTYDREIMKIPFAEIRKINALLAPTSRDLDEVVRDFEIREIDPEPVDARTRRAVAGHRIGAHDLTELRRLAVAAARLALPEASQLVAEFLDRSATPYTDPTWRFVLATASNSADPSFAALRESAAEAIAALGEDAVLSKLVGIVSAEELPDTSAPSDVDWAAVRRVVEEKYPELAAEVIDGARMMAARANREWVRFGEYYERYYRVAGLRSRYPFVVLTAEVFEHVVDPVVLNRAIDCVQRHLDTVVEDITLRRGHPIVLDVFANLLYKVGRTHEALVWQESAVRISQGRSREIEDRYRKMVYGRQTWLQD